MSTPIGSRPDKTLGSTSLPAAKTAAKERAFTQTMVAIVSLGAGVAASKTFTNRQVIAKYVKNLTTKLKHKSKCAFQPIKTSCRQGVEKIRAKFPKATFQSFHFEAPRFNMSTFGGNQVKRCIQFLHQIAEESALRQGIKTAGELLTRNETLAGSVIAVLVETGTLSYLQGMLGDSASEADFDEAFRGTLKGIAQETTQEITKAKKEAHNCRQDIQKKIEQLELLITKEQNSPEIREALMTCLAQYTHILGTLDNELATHLSQKEERLHLINNYLATSPKESTSSMQEFLRLSGIATSAQAVSTFVKKVSPLSCAGTLLALLTQATLDAATHTDHTHEKGLEMAASALTARVIATTPPSPSKETAEVVKKGLVPSLQSIPENISQKTFKRVTGTAVAIGLGKTIEEHAAFTLPKSELGSHVATLLRPIDVVNDLQNKSWNQALNRIGSMVSYLGAYDMGSDKM